MLLNKLAGKNNFVALIILLTITTVLVVAIFILTALIPNTLGVKPYDYDVTAVNQFEPWSFEVDGFVVDFPEGGLITTLNESGGGRSYLLLGRGHYDQNGLTRGPDDTGGLFIAVEDFFFEEIRGSNIFLPVEDESVLRQVEDLASKQVGLPSVWNEMVPLVFHSETGLYYYYFLTPEGEPLLPPHTEHTFWSLYGTFSVYIHFILIMLLLISIFTLDHAYSRYWFHLGSTPPGTLSLLMAPFSVIVFTGFKILFYHFGWTGFYSSIGYAIVIVMLVILTRIGKVDYLDLGLRRDRVRHGYFLAVLSALLIILTVRGLPQGICTDDIMDLLQLPLLFLFFGLPRELIWRGFIQAVLSRQLGLTRGLIVMIILASLSRFSFIALTTPWMLSYPYTYLELAVLVPGLAAILGYLYTRTENILACALLHSLVIWLPGIILY